MQLSTLEEDIRKMEALLQVHSYTAALNNVHWSSSHLSQF